MTGLREYERDLALPRLLGDGGIQLPESDQLLEWVMEGLIRDGGPRPISAAMSHARWKPGVSCVGTWLVRFEDGSDRIVVLKRYAGNGAAQKGERGAAGIERHFTDEHMLPFAVLPEHGVRLWTFPADRSLEGAVRVMDAQRSARLVDRVGVTSPWTTKGSLSVCQLLRYKPERRAVVRFSARLHRPAPKPRMRDFVLRALTLSEAAAAVCAREALRDAGDPTFVPALLGHELSSGILVEQFVEGVPRGPEDFSAASPVGAVVAQLHGLPVDGPSALQERASGPNPLLRADATLSRLPEISTPALHGPLCWLHGDLHPDQVMQGPEGQTYLMDMDALRVGDPCEDLSSWIADQLAAEPDCSYAQASEAFLSGYLESGGRAPDAARLLQYTAHALQRRALASLRRLERNGLELARERMERAWELVGVGQGKS